MSDPHRCMMVIDTFGIAVTAIICTVMICATVIYIAEEFVRKQWK